jgi:hypothetical protein
VAKLIDPEELPFTADEIYEAGRTFLRQGKARMMADHLATIGPGLIKDRKKRRASWRRAGVPNAAALPLYGWVYPDELLPALEVLSTEARERVIELRRRLSLPDGWGTAYKCMQLAGALALKET